MIGRAARSQLILRRFEACGTGFGQKTIAASKWQGPLWGMGGAISQTLHATIGRAFGQYREGLVETDSLGVL